MTSQRWLTEMGMGVDVHGWLHKGRSPATVTTKLGGLDIAAEGSPDGLVIANAAILVSFAD